MRLAALIIALPVVAVSGVPGSAVAQSNLLDQGKGLLEQMAPGKSSSPSSGGGVSTLTTGQADSGLREALKVAAQKTIGQVGKTDGYNKDPSIHIPLPGSLESAKSTLDKIGAGSVLDDLELKMNRAAEIAAPKAMSIFTDAITKMSVSDAKGIVTGPNDAATQYFKRTTTGSLTQAFTPIVHNALSQVGAVTTYNAAMKQVSSSPLGALAGGNKFDLDQYAVGKALDGIFHYIAAQEAQIRTNPAARTTALLKQVFGR